MMAAWLVASVLAGADRLAAQGSPVGRFRAASLTLTLDGDGNAILAGLVGPLSIGRYQTRGDTLVVRDESGVAACPSESGRYRWRLGGDTLVFAAIADGCAARRAALERRWVRGDAVVAGAPAGLQAVLITAQRQAEDPQRAPVAITVLPASTVRDANVSKPQDLTYLVPGLQVGALVGSSALLYLRGVGNFAGNSLQDPTVTMNVDGVYIARQTAMGGVFYDLDRVEVLKGPQGTLYGRNATGGAINILPQRPRLGIREASFNASYGAYNAQQLDGAWNLPLGTRAAMRVAGQRVRHDGYMRDGTDDQDDWAARLSTRYDVTPAFTVRASADVFHQGGRGVSSTPLGLGVGNRFGVTSSEGRAFYQTQRHTLAGRPWNPLVANQYVDNQHAGASATADLRSGVGAWTLIAASRRSTLDARGTPSGNIVTQQEHSTQNSVELRLASKPAKRVDLLVGTFLLDEEIATTGNEQFRPYNQYNVVLQQPQSGVTSTAAFGRITWHVTDRLRATLGGRYTREQKYFRGTFESFSRVCVPPPTAQCPNAQPFPVDLTSAPLVFAADSITAIPVFNPADGTRTIGFRIRSDTSTTFARATWRGALEYDLASQTFVYGSYETGFKSGGFFFSNDGQVYQPETVGALTVGLKKRLLANRLQTNVELFRWRYTDQQVSKLSVDSRGVNNLRTENIGQATIQGAEAELAYAPAAASLVTATVQYLDATYDRYTYVTPLGSGPPVSGCVVSTQTTGFLVNCNGRQSPYAPRWTAGMGGSQRVTMRGGSSLSGNARARFQSRTLMGLDFLAQQQQRAYTTLDLSLAYATARDRYSLTLFAQNVANQAVLSNSFVVPFSGFAIGVMRPPRTVGVRIGAAW
jgi:iron complex outermembrane receptor protein